MTRPKSKAAFPFVLDLLEGLPIIVKPLFGWHAVYRGPRILFVLRNRPDHPRDNGVWLATVPEHHASLKRDFPKMRSIELFGPGTTTWQNLPASARDFEESVERACEFVRKQDPRIGKVPARKKKKA